MKETLHSAETGDALELDEMWSFVEKKANKRWLWERIPEAYRSCHAFSDLWEAYQKVFPEALHHPTEKGSGETSHLERWNLHIRQRLARFARKRLAFSKSEGYHRWVTRLFIHEYNQSVSTTN